MEMTFLQEQEVERLRTFKDHHNSENYTIIEFRVDPAVTDYILVTRWYRLISFEHCSIFVIGPRGGCTETKIF